MRAFTSIVNGLLKGTGIDDAAGVIKSTPVNHPSPTEVLPTETATALDSPVVKDKLAQPLPDPPQITPDPEPGPTPPTPDEPPSAPARPPEEDPDAGLMPDEDVQKTAEELSGAEFDPELQGGAAGDAVEQLNFNTITDNDGIKAVEQKIAQGMTGQIDEARRGVITHEQLGLLSDDLGLQREVVEKIMKRSAGDTLNAESILAARKVLQASSERLKDLADQIATGNATGIQKLEFRRQMMFHSEYYKGFMGARAEAGRALNVFRVPVGSEEGVTNRLLELSESAQGIRLEEAAAAIRATGSVSEVTAAAREIAKVGPSDVAFEVFVNSILSGFRTQEVNFIGNALFQSMQAAEHGVAAMFGGGKIDRVYPGEATAQIYGTLHAFNDALKFWAKAVKAGESTDAVEKFEQTVRRRAIASENFAALQGSDPLTHALARAVDFMGAAIRLPTERGLTPMDELFKTLATRGKLTSLAYREASAQARIQGLNPQEASALLADLLRNPTANISKQAADASYEATFQKALGETGRGFHKLISTTPGVRWIAPFVKTLINVFNEGLVARTPLGLLSPGIQADLRAGGARGDLAKARLAMGSLTILSVAMMAKGGHVTGGSSGKNRGRNIDRAAGHQDYSIRYQDPMTGEVKYISYHRMEPLSMVIGVTADLVELLDYLDRSAELEPDMADQAGDIVAALMGAIAENTINKSFMSGVSQFFETMGDPQRYGSNYLKGFGVAMVPFSGARRDLTKISDPYLRQSMTLLEKMKATVPGLSDGLPLRLDPYGDPIEHPSGPGLGVLSITPSKTQSKDFVKLEVQELMKRTDRVPITMPSKHIEGMKLTSQEYHDLVFLSRKGVMIGGKTFEDVLGDRINSQRYLLASLDDRVDMIKAVQISFDKRARLLLARERPEFAMRLEDYRDRKEAIEDR